MPPGTVITSPIDVSQGTVTDSDGWFAALDILAADDGVYVRHYIPDDPCGEQDQIAMQSHNAQKQVVKVFAYGEPYTYTEDGIRSSEAILSITYYIDVPFTG